MPTVMRAVGFGAHPFVGLGVLQIGGNVLIGGSSRCLFMSENSDRACRCARTAGARRARRALRAADLDLAALARCGAHRHPRERDRRLPSVGEKLPLVISPSPRLGDDLLVPAQHAARPSSTSPTSCARAGLALLSPARARPTKSRSAAPRPRSSRGRIRAAWWSRPCLAVEVHARFQAQGVARAEAAAGDTPRAESDCQSVRRPGPPAA